MEQLCCPQRRTNIELAAARATQLCFLFVVLNFLVKFFCKHKLIIIFYIITRNIVRKD